MVSSGFIFLASNIFCTKCANRINYKLTNMCKSKQFWDPRNNNHNTPCELCSKQKVQYKDVPPNYTHTTFNSISPKSLTLVFRKLVRWSPFLLICCDLKLWSGELNNEQAFYISTLLTV